MMILLLPLAAFGLIVTFLAWACADFPSPLPFLRTTLLPLTKREFLFPECPFCWGLRGVAVAMLIVLIAS